MKKAPATPKGGGSLTIEDWYLPSTEAALEAAVDSQLKKLEGVFEGMKEELLKAALKGAGEALSSCTNETAFADFNSDGNILIELPIGDDCESPKWEVRIGFAIEGVCDSLEDGDAEDFAYARRLRDNLRRLADTIDAAVNKHGKLE